MKLWEDLTQGRLFPQITRFALPLIASTILQNLYNTVDMIFVGRYANTASLAAISVCGPIMQVITIVMAGMSSGVSVVIANYQGQKKEIEIRKACNTAICFYACLAVVVTLAGQIWVKEILLAVNTPAEAIAAAHAYLSCVFWGVSFTFGYNLVCAMQRGFGDSRSALMFVSIASVANILLDYLLVCVLGKGAGGAALGTVISQGISFGVSIWHFRRQGHAITFSHKEMRFSAEPLRQILRIGLPTALNEVFVTLAMLTVSATANTFGVAASAAYGIGRRVDGLAIITDGAMNNAMAAFASQNVGAGKSGRALQGLKASLLLSGCISLAILPIVYFFSPQIAALFDPNPEVVQYATGYLRISVYSYLFFCLVGPLIGFIRGTGNQMTSVLVGLVAQYAFRVPCAILGAKHLGFQGVALGILAGPVSSVAMYSIVILSGRWHKGLDFLRGGHAAADERKQATPLLAKRPCATTQKIFRFALPV